MKQIFLKEGLSMDRNSLEYMEQQFSTARMNLLVVVSFTVTNIIMLLAGTYSQFLFSAAIPYLLTAFGVAMDMQYGGNTYVTTALIISAAILLVYVVLWLLSKKRPALLYVAFGLFALDTLLLLGFALLAGSVMDEILNLGLHGWVLFILFKGASTGLKLRAMTTADAPLDPPTYTSDLDL
jgi:hypothetical protein